MSGLTKSQARQASVLRQRLTLALLEFGADLGVASVERIDRHRAELIALQHELDRLRLEMSQRKLDA